MSIEQADSDLPRISGRSDDDERLAIIIWPSLFSGPAPSGPIDPELLYRNCRAYAEETFSESYDNWERHNKCNPTRLVVCGHRTELRADALIAADLTTSCCSFMCEVLEYNADYLLDHGKSRHEALRDFDKFANDLINETRDHKWLPGVHAISLSEKDASNVFGRAVRRMVSGVRCRFGRLAWNTELKRTDEAIYNPPLNEEGLSHAATGHTPKPEQADDEAPWNLKLRAARKSAKLSRPGAAKRLKEQEVQITADAIKKHEEGKAKPRPAVRKAYAAIYNSVEGELFPE